MVTEFLNSKKVAYDFIPPYSPRPLSRSNNEIVNYLIDVLAEIAIDIELDFNAFYNHMRYFLDKAFMVNFL